MRLLLRRGPASGLAGTTLPPVQLTLLPHTGEGVKPSSSTLLSAVARGLAVVYSTTAGRIPADDRAEEYSQHQAADRPERNPRIVAQPPRGQQRGRAAAEPAQQPGRLRGQPRAADHQADQDQQQTEEDRRPDALASSSRRCPSSEQHDAGRRAKAIRHALGARRRSPGG